MIDFTPLVGIIDWGSLFEATIPVARSLAPPMVPPDIFDIAMNAAEELSFA